MTINFVETDAEKIYENIITGFQKALKKVLYSGDERRIFLEQETAVIVAMYNAINESARQNLLRYAKGEVLDAIGEDRETPRLEAKKSTVVIRFTLSSVRPDNIIIPPGTKVTPDGLLFFETKEQHVIYSGNLYKDIECIATVAGTAHNGLTPGQINTLSDPIAFVGAVSNITTSKDGMEREADDNGIDVWSGYRLRIKLSRSKLSTAGHESGYIYFAKTADSDIEDVSVLTPGACEILITVLMKNGELPTQGVLDKVLEVCSAKKVRPMTDHVAANAPSIVNYNIDTTFYIAPENSMNADSIIAAVNNAVEEYNRWQSAKLGRDINPDELRKLVLNAGSSYMELDYPVYTFLSQTQIAKANTVSVTYGGIKQ